MEQYEPPTVLATYTVQALIEEAAICLRYDGGGNVGGGRRGVGPVVLPNTGASGLTGGGLPLSSTAAAGAALLGVAGYALRRSQARHRD